MFSIVVSTVLSVKMFLEKMKDDHVGAYAAQATLFIIISLFPFVMLLLSIIQFLPISAKGMISAFNFMLPSVLNSAISPLVSQIFEKTSPAIISVAAISTIWSAGKGVLALQKGLNAVYGIKETRNYFRIKLTSAFYALVFALILILTMVLFVFGNTIYLLVVEYFPVIQQQAFIVNSLRTLVGYIALLIFFLLVYKAIPNRKARILCGLPGAFITATGWAGFSYVFSYYISNISKYRAMYGSLITIVLFLLWMYFCIYILFIGGEINAILYDKKLISEFKFLFKSKKDISND